MNSTDEALSMDIASFGSMGGEAFDTMDWAMEATMNHESSPASQTALDPAQLQLNPEDPSSVKAHALLALKLASSLAQTYPMRLVAEEHECVELSYSIQGERAELSSRRVDQASPEEAGWVRMPRSCTPQELEESAKDIQGATGDMGLGGHYIRLAQMEAQNCQKLMESLQNPASNNVPAFTATIAQMAMRRQDQAMQRVSEQLSASTAASNMGMDEARMEAASLKAHHWYLNNEEKLARGGFLALSGLHLGQAMQEASKKLTEQKQQEQKKKEASWQR